MFGPLRRLHEKQAHARFADVVFPPCFFGDNVVAMERKFCGAFWKVTILATSLRTADDFCFQCAVWTCHRLKLLGIL